MLEIIEKKALKNFMQKKEEIQEKMARIIASILDELWYNKEKLKKIDGLINKIFSDEPLSEQDKNFINSLNQKYLKTLRSRWIKYLEEEIISKWYLVKEKVYNEFINSLTLKDLLVLDKFTEIKIKENIEIEDDITKDEELDEIRKQSSIAWIERKKDNLNKFCERLSDLIQEKTTNIDNNQQNAA